MGPKNNNLFRTYFVRLTSSLFVKRKRRNNCESDTLSSSIDVVYLCSLLQSYTMSRVMRNPGFWYAKTKTQISFREADQRLCFRYTDSTIPLLPKFQNFKLLFVLCDCTARFVSDLVGNRFSHNEAPMKVPYSFNKRTSRSFPNSTSASFYHLNVPV